MMTSYMATGEVPGPAGSTSPAAAPYEAFQTSDSWVLIAAGNDRLFARFCDVLGLCRNCPQDPRFVTNSERVPRRAELHEILEARHAALHLRRVDRRYCAKPAVPVSVINTLDKVLADEQVNTLGMLPPVAPDFRIPEMKFVDIPVTIDGERVIKRLMPPRLGEHTDEVLHALGLLRRRYRGDAAG